MTTHSSGKCSSRKPSADRPKKPYPGFPLGPHPSGKWQKRIRGTLHYFGRWAKVVNGKRERIPGDGWEEAMAIYKAQAEDLHAGRTPRVKGNELTVMDLCNRFLTAKKRKLDAGEMSARMFAEYQSTTDRLMSTFQKNRLVDDLASDDFEALRADLAEQFGPVRRGNEIQKIKTVFLYAFKQRLIDRPVQCGEEFKKPSRKVMRLHKKSMGKRTFGAEELRAMIGAAGVHLKAMFFLGINAGFGNADCGQLPLAAVDLEGGWVTFERPKTGIPRRCPLWPETAIAIRESIAERPEPKNEADAGLVFITKYGRPWSSGGKSGAVTLETSKLLRKLGINGHRNFYALRHTFRTIADETKDRNAIRLIMGHIDGESIDDEYTHGSEDERMDNRLRAVAGHVRQWFYGAANT